MRPDATALVLGHRLQLEQVFINLFINACQAMESCRIKELTISIGMSDTEVHVRVADNGSGIPSEDLTRIFEPFFTTKPAGKGTGLGLSISAGIIADHGGTLRAENGDPGAIFSITLPRLRAEQSTTVPASSRTSRAEANGDVNARTVDR